MRAEERVSVFLRGLRSVCVLTRAEEYVCSYEG